MKQVLLSLILSLLCCLSSFAGAFSTYPSTNTVNDPDLLLMDSKVGSAYATRTSTVSNLANSATVQKYLIGTSNGFAVGLHHWPTNQYWLTNHIVISNAVNTAYSPDGAFAYFNPGDDFVLTNGDTTVGQFKVFYVIDANHARICQPATASFTNVAWFYPCADYFHDNTSVGPVGPSSRFFGSIGNDASLMEVENAGFWSTYWANSLACFGVQVYNEAGGPFLYFGSDWVTAAGSFKIGRQAQYDSLRIENNGTLSSRFGLTNTSTGQLLLRTKVAFPEGQVNSNKVFEYAATTASPVSTISGVNGSYVVTGSGGTFSSVSPGDQIIVPGHGYLVGAVSGDGTKAYLLDPLQGTLSSSSWTYNVGSRLTYTAANVVGSFTGAEGTMGSVGNWNGRFLIVNPHETQTSAGFYNDTDNRRFSMGSLSNSALTQFNIGWKARYDSLNINDDSTVAIYMGLTNGPGAADQYVHCFSPFYCSSNFVTPQGLNTGISNVAPPLNITKTSPIPYTWNNSNSFNVFVSWTVANVSSVVSSTATIPNNGFYELQPSEGITFNYSGTLSFFIKPL